MKKLRPYQQSAVESLFDYYKNNGTGNPIIVAPVGAGKSLIIAEIIKRILQWNNTKIVMLSHVQELLLQDAGELEEYYPEAEKGFYCAGLKQKDLHQRVIFASIQSIASKASGFAKPPDVIIIDECHLISHKQKTQYRRFISDCKLINPNLIIVGLTGTPFRSDTGRLDKGDNKLFDEIIYEIEIGYMIDNGFLCKPTTKDTSTRFDLSGVQMRGGDYIQGQLEKAVDDDVKTKSCIDEIIEKGANRNKWLVFTAGIAHCEHVLEELQARGVKADMLIGDTEKDERSQVIERFKNGELQCLVNVAVLTTGFNVPDIDMIVFMRPTRSPVLYIQCVGRGLRTVYANSYDLETVQGRLDAIKNSKKQDCLILDFGEIIENLGAIDKVKLNKTYREKEEGQAEKREVNYKRCPVCNEVCYPNAKYCLACGYNFLMDIELAEEASRKSIMSTEEEEPVTVKVLDWNRTIHVSKKGHELIKVTYFTTIKAMYQWINVGHPTSKYARDMADYWHKQHTKDASPPPATPLESLQKEYFMPVEILAKPKGNFYEVLETYLKPTKQVEKEEPLEYNVLGECPF